MNKAYFPCQPKIKMSPFELWDVVVEAVGMWVTWSVAQSYPHTHSPWLGFGSQWAAIRGSPGVIGGGFVSRALAAQGIIDILGFDDFRPTGLLVEDGKFKRLAFAENNDLTGGIFTNGD